MKKIATNFASLKDIEEKQSFLDKIPLSAINGGLADEYYQTLIDFDFIYLKIQYPRFGVEALIRDYALIYDPEIFDNLEQDEKLDSEQIKILKLIQDALRLSAHVLNQDQTQLVGQLWGRLQSFPQPEIQQILADAVENKSEIPRFRPITASLTTPGGNLLRTLTGHNSGVNAVAIAPDGKTAVSGSGDKTLKQWDLQTGKEISTLTGHNDWVYAVAIAPDGKTAVSGSGDKTLKQWDLQTGKEISTLTGHNSSVLAVAIAPDGKTAVSASDDNTLKQWDLQTGKEISTLTGHNSRVLAVAIAPDGKTAVSASNDKTLKQWDLQTAKEIEEIKKNLFKYAIYIFKQRFNLLKIKEISTLTGHNSSVLAVVIAPDGKTAVSASYDNTLKQWDLETGKEISTLTGHNSYVSAVAIAPDGKTAVSGSDDNTLKRWDLQTGKEISTFIGDSPIICCAVSLDGLTIIAGESSGRVHFLRLEGG
ncbi:WD40 repeat domain-containing protein [Nostoc sp. LPT]|uniref:WD40 repeat domain-containing protein n=1 Tax=Nostoc sp. LPT TaxID=2815387 RepID=UPI001D98AF65|nr:WD40 repeat domain-containing protein [Nostoc sp. LPT]MBN4001409.1 WD40 repeat domain-containing protein [Nostoc sp. LPT]